jgi:hypothetical protein
MRSFIIASILFVPVIAAAQTVPQPPSPQMQALAATVMQLTQETVELRTEIFALRAENDTLKATAKKADAAPPADAPAH